MSETVVKKPHFFYLDVLRMIACFLIVCVHVCALNWNDVEAVSSQWQVMNAYDCIGLLGVPLFFMMSGALFLREDAVQNLRQLYLHNILRLFLIYHIWLFFYNLLPFLWGEIAFSKETVKYELLDSFLCGTGIYHLWFLPELIIMYMLVPVLREAFRKKETCQYFLVLFACFGAFLPMILKYYFPYRKYVASYYERTSLVMLTGYIGYFILGHYLHSFGMDLTKRARRIGIWIGSIVACGVTILACSVDAISKNQPSVLLNTPFSLASFIACIGIFSLCRYYCRNYAVSKKKSSPEGTAADKGKVLRRFSDMTFGVYLLHPFVLEVLKRQGITTTMLHPVISIPLLTVLVFILCLIPVWLLKKIPFLGKWIV